jgi:hypothetical protein
MSCLFYGREPGRKGVKEKKELDSTKVDRKKRDFGVKMEMQGKKVKGAAEGEGAPGVLAKKALWRR